MHKPATDDASLARAVGCTICSYSVSRWLEDGERIRLGGVPQGPEPASAPVPSGPDRTPTPASAGEEEEDVLEVCHTPGHTPDSVCLWLAREKLLFVGATLYPHSAVLLAAPHSDLRQYVASMQALRRRFGRAADGVTWLAGTWRRTWTRPRRWARSRDLQRTR